MDVFREAAHRRWRRQASTVVRAVRAGRARAKADPGHDVVPAEARLFAAFSQLLPQTCGWSGCR